MSQCVRRRLRFTTSMIPTITPRYFMLITCLSLMVSVIWIQLIENGNLANQTEILVTEALQNVARDHRYAEVYRKVEKLQKDMKYILIWTPYEFAPFYYFGNGQRKFIDLNCPNINCYVTTDVNFFNGDTTKFHAIAFNGRNVDEISKFGLPKYRSPHQKFIYFNLESADNYPVCSEFYDGFFNWTSTYRLDSDLPYPYIQIKNFRGEIIGPKKDMKWITDNETSIDEDLEMKIQNKTKAVAWFVSHCGSRSGRKEYAKLLQKALKKYGLTVDIYGACGTLKCPRSQKKSCFSFLERDYFFYLSFENSFSDDYVTEKLLTALNHNAVPIVFGGADYSRFLPPGSYINARVTNPQDLADILYNLIASKENYKDFFHWKSLYSYRDPSTTDNVCSLCAALNNKELFEKPSVYKHFREWWYPSFEDRCKT